MSDQNLVKKHLELLRNAQNINKEHKCLEALDILENHFDGTLSSPEINHALQLMLNYGYKDEKISLPNFLVTANAKPKGAFTNSVKRLFKLIQNLTSVYPEQVKIYSACLVNFALIFIKSADKPSFEREAAAHLISEFLKMNAMSPEVDMGKIITETLRVLNQRGTANLSRLPQQLFLILGMISKTRPDTFSTEKATEFRNLLMNRILSLFKDDKATIQFTMISGAIEGLTIHLQNFTPTEEEDQKFGENLYESMLWLTDPKKADEITRRDAFRKMLELITKFNNIHGIPNLMFRDYKKWQSVFLQWISSGNYDDQNAGVQAMQAFHERVAEVLENRKDSADVAVLQFFLNYFSATLQNQDSQPHEIRIAIRGFGAMAAACKSLKETNYLSQLFDLVMQRTEYSYYTNDRLKRRKVLEHLPSYVESLSKIMNHLDEISGIQLQSLQSVIVVLIKDFYYLPTIYHSIVPISLMETFLNLQKSGEKVLQDVMDHVIRQGILWTCSHQLTYDVQENLDNIDDWKETVTYRRYLPLWNQLFKASKVEYKSISEMIFDTFVKNLYEIIEKLNLSTRKRTHSEEMDVDYFFNNPLLDVEPVRPEEFQILYNLVQFYGDVFKGISNEFLRENFSEWLEHWLEDTVRFSIQNPLVSGFLQILEIIVKTMEKLSYNNEVLIENDSTMMKNLEVLNFFIRTSILVRSTQFSGELQISCLNLVFQLPTPILKNLIKEIPPIFIIGFTIGRGVLTLAHSALSCFERIVETLADDSQSRQKLLEEVLPCFESFLSSHDSGSDEIRKMVKRGKKTHFIGQSTSDSDLMRFKKRILWCLGNFDLDEAQLILSKFEPKLVRIFYTSVLEIKLETNENSFPQIYLDDSVWKICELAMTSSERSSKIAACELLHGLAVYMIGKTLEGPSTLPLWREICRSLFLLAADKDETIRQMFEPLLKQIIHYFSKSDKILSPMTKVLIETLMAMISCQSNSSVQDLSSLLLNEFLRWMNRQCDKSQRQSSPINLVDLFHEMRKMSLETDESRRMGATMAFNNIYRIIREDEDIVDVYWIYLLELFCTNFKNSEEFGTQLETNFVDGRRYEQITSAMNHIQRVFVERSKIFHKLRENRIQPEGFDGKTLFDVMKWIFAETGQPEYFYRQKCMKMFLEILPECGTKKEFFENHLSVDKVLEIGAMKNVDLHFLKNSRHHIYKETSKWLRDLLRSLDFYVWIFENELIPENMIGQLLEKSNILPSMKYFLCDVVLKDLDGTIKSARQNNDDATEQSVELKLMCQNLHNIGTYRCINLVRMIDFLTIACRQEKVKSFLIENISEFIKVTKQLVFNPEKRGFDYKSNNPLLKLPHRIIRFIGLSEHGPTDFKLKLLDVLKLKFSKHLNSIFVNFNKLSEEKSINVVVMNKLNGIELIVDNVRQNFSYICIEEGFNIVTAEAFITRIFENIVEKVHDGMTPKHLTPAIKRFMMKIFSLCLKIDNFISKIVELILNDRALKTSNNCQILHGEFFLQTFKTSVFNHFIINLPETIDSIMKVFESSDDPTLKLKIISILSDFNDFIFKNYSTSQTVLTKNLHQMEMYGPKIITSALQLDNTLNRVDLTLIDLVSHMAMVCPIELVNFGRKLEIENWVLKTLGKPENSLELKSKFMGLIPLITSVNDSKNNNLSKALRSVQSCHLPMTSAEFKEGSVQRATLANFSKELFKALLISRSPIIHEFIIVITVSDDEYFLESKLQQVQCELMEKYLDANGQEIILNHLFEAFAQRGQGIRLKFITRYFQTLLKCAKVDVMVNFLKSQIETIWSFSEQTFGDETSKVLMNRCIGFQIVEAFYASVPKDKIYNAEFSLNGKTVTGNELTKMLIRKCKEKRKEVFLVENQAEQEMFRKYQCNVYRALAAIISNTQSSPEVYCAYLFHEPEPIWVKMIDVKNLTLFGELKQEFEEYPRIKEYITSVKDLTTGGQKKNYNETVSIFDKSLSQSLTKNDLTYSVVLSSREAMLNAQMEREQEHQNLLTIQLESTPINDHEVMPVLVGVVKHIYNNKISPTQNFNAESPNKYKWVIDLADSIATSKHKNVKLFLLKLVDNCRDIFQHYAEFLFGPILSVITNGQYISKMSFFLTDLILMLLSWSSNYKLENENIAQRNDINALFKFLISEAYNERSEIFRLNLELIKKVCETWKEYLQEDIPTRALLDSLNIEKEEMEHRLRCGLQVNCIVLVNEILPWRKADEQEMYVEKIWKCLIHEKSQIWQPAAFALGMCLNLKKKAEGIEENFVTQITERLQKMTSKITTDKFLQILYGIHKSYPEILDPFLTLVKANIPSAIKNLKRVYLEMYLSRLETDDEYVYREIKSFFIKNLLKQTEYQKHALFVFNKSIEYLSLNQAFEFLDDLKNLFKSVDDDIRKLLVEILINIHEKFKGVENYNKKSLLSVLLKGFSDSNYEIQNRVINFFYDADDFPKEIIPRFLMILEDLYVPELEKDFLNYATILLLDVPIKHPKSKLKLLDYDPTRNHDFTEFSITTASSYQRSLAPMFIPSSQSRLKSGSMIQGTQSSSQDGIFFPTQDPIEMSRSQTFVLKETQKSLLFHIKPQYLDKKSNIIAQSLTENVSNSLNNDIIQNDMTALDKFRKRFLRQKDDEKSEKSRYFAKMAVDTRNYRLEQEMIQMKRLKEGRDVKLYRRYRDGDFPDFFFTTLSVLLPLQALVKKEPSIARDVLINIFESLTEIVAYDETQMKLFYESINRCVMKILQSSMETDSFLIATLLHMVIKSGKYLEISPVVLSNVVTANKLMVSGIVFLEHQLKLLLSDEVNITNEPLAKRRRNQENSDENEILLHWTKVIDLLHKIHEYEAIQGIFTDKLNLPLNLRHDLMNAVDLESKSQYHEASEVYKKILDNEANTNSVQADVYRQSYYNCLENLADWSEISSSIKNSLKSYEDAWEGENRDTVLPHLLKTEVRLIVSTPNDEFVSTIEKWLSDEFKSSYLSINFPEQVVIMEIAQANFIEASVEVEKAMKVCAEEWSCLERIDEKLICLKESRMLAELNNFTYLMALKTIDEEKHANRLKHMIQNWKISRAKPADSLSYWRDMIMYRNIFINFVAEDVRSSAESYLMKTHQSLVDVVFIQKNCDTAEFLIKNLRDELKRNDMKTSSAAKNEKILKYYLAQGKYNLMKSEITQNSWNQQIGDLKRGLNYLVPNIVKKSERFERFPKYLVESYECASEISWKLCQLFRNEGLEQPLPDDELMSLIQGNRNLSITENLWTFSRAQLIYAKQKARIVYEESNSTSENEYLFGECYLKIGKFYHQTFDSGYDVSTDIQCEIIKEIFRAIAHDVKDAKFYLPFILDLPDLKNGVLAEKFNEILNVVPVWMFIPYISQILSNYDFENDYYLDNLLLKIAKKYPNALYFPFKLSLINYHETSNNGEMMKPKVAEIENLIYNKQLDEFVKAVECLVLPEKLVGSQVQSFSSKVMKGEIKTENDFKEEFKKLYHEAFEKNGDMKGAGYDRMDKIQKKIEALGKFSWEKDYEKIRSSIRKIHEEIRDRYTRSSLKAIETRRLCRFFENYKWNGGNDYIEVPGQYSGEAKPFIEKHVKIVRFNEKLKVFRSKQQPIELKVFGSDGKVHSFIVKMGEDLRQDQRIQQVLQLMSNKLALDKNCKQNHLEIQTYNVIPINLNCGLLSVVDNALTLTEFLDDACSVVIQKTYTGMDNAIRGNFRSFLVADEPNSNIIDAYKRAVKNYSREEFIEELTRQEKVINPDIFHQWFMQYALSLEAYYILRKNFINSLTAMNAAHFVLGIGDRHLGNTLINKSNAKMIGIDFGISFCAGLHLDLPELVPCRLTSHFVNVIEPHGIEGIIKRNMIHTMRCLKDNKETLLICLEMFIKEPTMDWLLRSKSKSHQTALVWNPEQRINTVKQKLYGVNPTKIACDELALSAVSRDIELLRCYHNLVRGGENSKRIKMNEQNLSVEDQITAVIEMATDKALLATLWVGWDPWI